MGSKLVLENQFIGQVKKFNFLGCFTSYLGVNINHKTGRFNCV
jgi:hypothetical protein